DPAAELTGDDVMKLIHPDDLEMVRSKEDAARVSGHLENEFRIIRPDGEVRWLAAYGDVIRDSGGTPVQMVGLNVDITDRKQAEGGVPRARQQLQMATESLSITAALCRGFKYLWVNKACAEFFGLPQEEIVGRPVMEILGPSLFEQLRPHLEEVLRGERTSYEWEAEWGGRGPRWIHAVYSPTFDAEGKPDGWVAVSLDITERHRAEETVKALNVQLAADLEGMTRVQELSTRIVAAGDFPRLMDEILNAAILITAA